MTHLVNSSCRTGFFFFYYFIVIFLLLQIFIFIFHNFSIEGVLFCWHFVREGTIFLSNSEGEAPFHWPFERRFYWINFRVGWCCLFILPKTMQAVRWHSMLCSHSTWRAGSLDQVSLLVWPYLYLSRPVDVVIGFCVIVFL